MTIKRLCLILLLTIPSTSIATEVPVFKSPKNQEKWCTNLFNKWQDSENSLRLLEKQALTLKNAKKYIRIKNQTDKDIPLLSRHCFYGQ